MATAKMIETEPKVRLTLNKREAELVRAWAFKCVDWDDHSYGTEAQAIWDALTDVGDIGDITGDVDVLDPDASYYSDK